MPSITFLGTSCGFPLSDRNFTALLCKSTTTTLLLDAGEPVSRTLRQREFDFESLEAVCISHGHSDHTGGFPMLIQTMWLAKRRRPLPVYLPRELIEPLRTWLKTVYLSPDIVPFEIRYHAWEEQTGPVTIGDTTLTPIPGSHLHLFRDQLAPGVTDRFLSYLFIIESGEHRMVWSADIGAPGDLLPALEKPISLLISEVAHFEPAALFELVARKEVQQLAVTHCPRTDEDYFAELEQTAKEILPATTHYLAAEDGMTLDW